MRLLLDTHALLWMAAADDRLSSSARDAIEDAANECYVSAASAWEISTKHRLGKLPNVGALVLDFAGEVTRHGFLALDISLDHGQDAGLIDSAHRDPFDRMLAAQAIAERMALVSADRVFDEMGVTRIW